MADLTLVGESLSTRPWQAEWNFGRDCFQNPNVLIEYGYALRCHGHDNIIAVLNTAFGESHTDNLPFDLRHLRWPIKYHLSSDADASETQAALESVSFQSRWRSEIDSARSAGYVEQPDGQ